MIDQVSNMELDSSQQAPAQNDELLVVAVPNEPQAQQPNLGTRASNDQMRLIETHAQVMEEIATEREPSSAADTPVLIIDLHETDEEAATTNNSDNDSSINICRYCSQSTDSSMISCNKCRDWFHHRCVNLTTDEISILKVFYCTSCELDGFVTKWKKRPANSRQRRDKLVNYFQSRTSFTGFFPTNSQFLFQIVNSRQISFDYTCSLFCIKLV